MAIDLKQIGFTPDSGIRCVVAGQDAPEHVGIGIVVERACQSMDVGDHLSACFLARRYETGLAGERLAQCGQGLVYVLFVDDHFRSMFGNEFLNHLAPLRIALRRLRNHHDIVRPQGNSTAQQTRSAQRSLSRTSVKQHAFIPKKEQVPQNRIPDFSLIRNRLAHSRPGATDCGHPVRYPSVLAKSGSRSREETTTPPGFSIVMANINAS